MVAVTGCLKKKQPVLTDHEAFFETEGITRADSIVSEISDTRDMPLMIAAIDSLEKAGELSLAKTIFYRTIAYNMMGQQSTYKCHPVPRPPNIMCHPWLVSCSPFFSFPYQFIVLFLLLKVLYKQEL